MVLLWNSESYQHIMWL